MECSKCKKSKSRSEEEKRNLINRLNRIEGQIRGIRGMIEDDRYCVDILTQASAIEAAMRSFDYELLKNHIETCVVDGIRNNYETVVDELLSTVVKFVK